ncbi:phage portal protein [Kaistia geumhonensis]|uniref:HK97 family phage portal protein n=1 Tax=Kaistia geumhonensis TaxID=410839 RepID=A0ABU0M3N5_9HYPH|nr:phage portal protein [Kaistia geumhonensis]MCX5479216.1 phage portal protein [Kaistia geumhonensis]MDQ0515564.1 HK97 family phage portal protein [Kaistia geumhonensis]
MLERLRARLAALAPPRRESGRPPEAKASRAGPLIALQGQGRAVWSPRDAASLAREGFMKNAVVHRAVMMIASSAASVPLVAYEGDAERPDHPLLGLLAEPNRRQNGPAFLEALIANLLVAGNAYAELVMLGGQPAELHVLRPDRMRVVPGPDGWPEAYEYSVAGRTIRFPDPGAGGLAPILHLKLFHPLDDHYGFAPIEAAARALDLHNTAAEWNKALLDNSARPSGALVYRGEGGANLSQEQFERLKAELEQNYSGAVAAGRPLLLEGGLDWTSMALSPRDMDFLEAKNGAAREIALAFGVPPMLLAIPGDNTYANYAEANRAFWRQTVLPLVGRTAAALTAWLAPAYGGAVRLDFDADGVEALAADRESLWRRVEAASFLSRDEKRQAVGYGAGEDGDGEGEGGPKGRAA